MPNEPATCGGIAPPPADQGDTPYGYWHCTGASKWEWVAEIGRMGIIWNAFLSFFMVKP